MSDLGAVLKQSSMAGLPRLSSWEQLKAAADSTGSKQRETAAVNWRIVDAELSRVPQDFKDPKFYALKHVVEILTSPNPQAMVAQVRCHASLHTARMSSETYINRKYTFLGRSCANRSSGWSRWWIRWFRAITPALPSPSRTTRKSCSCLETLRSRSVWWLTRSSPLQRWAVCCVQ